MSNTYKITEHPTYIHVDVKEGFGLKNDAPQYIQEVTKLLDAASKPLFLSLRIGNLSWTVDDLIAGVGVSVRGGNAYLHHEKMRGLVVVTESKFFEIGIRGLNNPIFGNIPVKTFATDEEALAYIQEQG